MVCIFKFKIVGPNESWLSPPALQTGETLMTPVLFDAQSNNAIQARQIESKTWRRESQPIRDKKPEKMTLTLQAEKTNIEDDSLSKRDKRRDGDIRLSLSNEYTQQLNATFRDRQKREIKEGVKMTGEDKR